ncbi:hypothetical protein ACLESD_31200 [Pyxidicoccus sp. 3LFB2]
MKRLALLAACGLLLGTTGCALTPDPRKNLLEGTSGHAVYKLPPESLLTLSRELLVEQGYELLPTADPLYVHTTWRVNGNIDVGASWSRVLVQAHTLSDGRTMVRAYRLAYTTNGRAASHPGAFAGKNQSKSGKDSGEGQVGRYVLGEPMSAAKPQLQRATDFEWALLSRVDPQLSAHLQNRVDAYLAAGHAPVVTEEPAEGAPQEPAGSLQ